MQPSQPVIVTLQLDEKSHAFFQSQRAKYFPSQINYIGAHLTLFHNLPGAQFEEILHTVGQCCARSEAFQVNITGLMKLGRGVAYKVEAQKLLDLRSGLAASFKPWLSRQDKERFRPHITIQNKVAPHEATALFDHLVVDFEPFSAIAEGVQLWFYEGVRNRAGTWASAGSFAFQS